MSIAPPDEDRVTTPSDESSFMATPTDSDGTHRSGDGVSADLPRGGSDLPTEYYPLGTANPGFRRPQYLAELSNEVPTSVRTLADRLANDLTDAQRQTYDAFRSDVVVARGWHEAHGIDEWATLRFLFARQFDVKKAEKMLVKHVAWREEFHPDEATCSGCQYDPTCHCMHFAGWDLQHRPVLYMSYSHATDRQDPRIAVEHNVMSFNNLIRHMPEGVEQWVTITDFLGYSHWRDGRSKIGPEVAAVVQDQFPERLGLMILIDPPTAFWVFWKIISAFIDERTKRKVKFMYSKQEPFVHEEFPKLFPPHVAQYLIRSYRENRAEYKAGYHKTLLGKPSHR